jgi:hypothetical protein
MERYNTDGEGAEAIVVGLEIASATPSSVFCGEQEALLAT